MKILVACETSGMVRNALIRAGHEARSCDLLPAQDNSPLHIVGDMFEVSVREHWDGLIFHPDCTNLTVSAAWAFCDPDFIKYPGVGYHQRVKAGTLVGRARREAKAQAVDFARRGMNLPIERIVMENPIGALSSLYRKPSQIVQPYMFGDDASKATCLWMKGVRIIDIPPPETWHQGRLVEWPRGSGKIVRRWSNQTDSGQNRLTPSDNRWQVRADTYPGIANALSGIFDNAGCQGTFFN